MIALSSDRDEYSAPAEKLPLTERLQAFIGYSQFGNIDKLPHTMRDTIQADLERSGQLSGRRRYIFNTLPYHSLLRPMTEEEKAKNRFERLWLYEFVMRKLREYELLFMRTAAKLVLLDNALDQVIDYLKQLEDEHQGTTLHDQQVATQARAEREDLEEFQTDFIEQAQQTMQADPAPSQPELEQIEQTIDRTIQTNSLVNQAYTNGMQLAKRGFLSFFDAIGAAFISSDENHDTRRFDANDFYDDLAADEEDEPTTPQTKKDDLKLKRYLEEQAARLKAALHDDAANDSAKSPAEPEPVNDD